MNASTLKGGSFGEQRSLHAVGGFVVSETVHRRGQNLPRHAHARASINFVLGGAYAETFRGGNHAYSPATLIIKPAGETHANDFRESGARCLLIELTDTRLAALQPALERTRAPSSKVAPDLKPIALRIIRELRTPDVFSDLAMEARILELLVQAARAEEKAGVPAPPRWLQRVVERLHETHSELSLTELAADAGVHPAHLTRAFRRHFRESPGEYARAIRLQRAITLIMTTRDPLGRIALQAGFFDQSHFSRCIKRYTGMSPSALRRSIGC